MSCWDNILSCVSLLQTYPTSSFVQIQVTLQNILVWVDCISLHLILQYGIVEEHNDVLEVVVQDRKTKHSLTYFARMSHASGRLGNFTLTQSICCYSLKLTQFMLDIFNNGLHITNLYTNNSLCSYMYIALFSLSMFASLLLSGCVFWSAPLPAYFSKKAPWELGKPVTSGSCKV